MSHINANKKQTDISTATVMQISSDALPPAIHLRASDDLATLWPTILAAFNKHGFVVVEPSTDDKAVAIDICRQFGAIQGHARSKDGVVEVRSGKSANGDDRSIVADIPYFPHTDGIYLDGIFRWDGKLYRIGPPKIVALQCVKQAKRGGNSFLIDGAKVLRAVLDERPDLIPALFSHDCMGVWRKNHIALRVPVFDMHHSGNFSMYFSCDTDTYGSGKAIEALNAFNIEYLSNLRFRTYLTLSERQILLFDNHRFLHGRTEIEGERLLRRIWLWDEQISQEMSHLRVEGTMYERTYGAHEETVLLQYRDYAPLNLDSISKHREDITIGIPLSSKDRKRIETLRLKNSIMNWRFAALPLRTSPQLQSRRQRSPA